MQRIIIYTVVAVMTFLCQKMEAQATKDSLDLHLRHRKIEVLKKQREQVLKTEKDGLKQKVQQIIDQENAGEISKESAQELKKLAAEKAAQNIANITAIIDNKIALIERGEDYDDLNGSYFTLGLGQRYDSNGSRLLGIEYKANIDKPKDPDRKTRADIVLAFGLNQAFIDGVSFNDSPYKVGGSRFFELGWQWKTRLLGKNSDLRFVYGVSYQSNGLKPTNNQYFVKEGDNTTLDVYEGNLDKSKFRLDNLVIPLYLEFSPYKNRVREGFVSRYRNTFVLGVGGYAGLNLSARQKLKFNDESNHSKEK